MSDLEGYVIRYDTVMPDGRIIAKGAFAKQDGYMVPVTTTADSVGVYDNLGTAILSDRDEGVYATCNINGTPMSISIKDLIEKDPKSVEMSIVAAGCKQDGKLVRSGMIRRVYLKGRR